MKGIRRKQDVSVWPNVKDKATTVKDLSLMDDLPSRVSFHFVQDGMVNVLKYQMNSFLLSEYLNQVYQVRMLQHLQQHSPLGD